MRGLFITFEGADGCGKSTQLKFLAQFLEQNNVSVVCTREPGGSPIAEKIRGILLDKENLEMNAVTETLLYAAARAEHVRKVVRPALDAGKVVLCDRFIHSSYAYQGFGRGLGVKLVRRLNKRALDNCMPDITIFINISPERAFERMNELKQRDRLESESLEFHRRVFNGFIKISKSKGVISIDAKGSKRQTHELIIQKLMPVIRKAGLI
ncbi:MAG: dTMP kinase [Christensenellales bacterium]